MNILQLNKYISIAGGSESVMNDLSTLFFQRDHIVYNMGYHQEGKTLLQNIIDLGPERLTPIQCFTNVKVIKYIISFIINNKIDIIICHNIYHHFPCYTLLSQIKRNTQARCILIVHDPKPVCPNHMLFSHGKICEKCSGRKFYNCIKHRCKDDSFLKSLLLSVDSYYNSWLHDFYAFFDSIISPSLFLKNKLIKMGFKHPIHMLRNPFEINMAQESVEIPSLKNKTLLFVGRLSEEKGIQIILNNIDRLKDIRLHVIGDGPYRGMVESYANTNKNITYHGYKPRHEIFDWMTKSSYLILPTIWYENCPVIILEAMCKGLPVIGSCLGGIPEMVSNERGFVFDPFNEYSIQLVINNAFSIVTTEYNAISQRCKDFSKTVSFDNYYKQIYRYALSDV